MKKFLLVFSLVITTYCSNSQAFTPGNIVVSRYGDGVAALPTTSITVPIFLDEYTPAGVFVRSHPMPTVANGRNRVISGSATVMSEGLLSLSPNGHYLTNIGYNPAPGTAYSSSSQRIIAITTADGEINSSTTCPTNVLNPRCALSNNGGSIWFVGSNSGIRYKPVGTAAANNDTLSTIPDANKSLYIYNNQLYYLADYSTGPKIGMVGIGLNRKPGQSLYPLPGNPTTTNPTQMVMLDSDSSTAEPDLMYVTDETEGAIKKWVFTAGGWVSKGSVSVSGVTSKLRGITGEITQDGNVILYTMNISSVMKVVDSSAVASVMSATTHPPVVLFTAAANTLFKGIAYSPGTIWSAPSTAMSTISSSKYDSLIMANSNLIQSITYKNTTEPYRGVEETNIRYISNKGKNISAFFLKVDLSNPHITAEVATKNNVNSATAGTQTVPDMMIARNSAMTDKRVLAGTNGDYYVYANSSYYPEGIMFKEGAMLKDFPPDTAANKYFIGIKNDGTAIIGDKEVFNNNKAELRDALGGRFLLMQYGDVRTEHLVDSSVEPRTTAGLLSPTTLVYMVVDGRATGYSSGLSLTDMAYIYKSIGAYDAINMDGGGSSTFVVRNDTTGVFEPHNRPSDGSPRSVGGGAWVITQKLTALPVKLLQFSAMPHGKSVQLNWETENEFNNDYFTIQRSANGRSFKDVVRVKGTTGSIRKLQYRSVDYAPLEGKSYYRLKQTDLDGKTSYSNTVAVNFQKSDGGKLLIYPNPVTNSINIQLLETYSFDLKADLVNTEGKMIGEFQGTINAINQQLNKQLKSLAAGTYFIKLVAGEKTYGGSFIKN
jgi:exopolysaccharide biosynthesis protein